MTIIEYAEKIGLLKYLNNQSIDILERAQKAIENKEEYHVIVGARSARLLLQTIILKYEGYLEGCADGREDAIDECIAILRNHSCVTSCPDELANCTDCMGKRFEALKGRQKNE